MKPAFKELFYFQHFNYDTNKFMLRSQGIRQMAKRQGDNS